MTINFESSTMCLSNDDMMHSIDGSALIIDETELESLLLDLPPLDDCNDGEGQSCDVEIEIDSIPLDEITQGDGNEALVEYASALCSCFLSNDAAPIQDVNRIQEMPYQTKNKKTKKSQRTNKKTKKSKAGSGKKTTAKRKMVPKIKCTTTVTHLCPERDVVFGRGGHAVHNPGNGFLLEAVKIHSPKYKSLGKDKDGKVEKKHIVQLVAAMVEARGGRFLLRQQKDAPWQEASEQKVHEKIRHMLRDQPHPLKHSRRCTILL
ncbi:unnamed protein product [Cylindrotheca closterium]|uniref:DUF6824 domain-containing protein n=1 Tax=Cylindrotheca closterium TaxID=2856 RepID=A0AAD2FTL5_9STRA|nr:unnamed protein product [Cylindrotheca closterium]CAJ1952863.1 unnamed protein product [Cylindrotheca closterium]